MVSEGERFHYVVDGDRSQIGLSGSLVVTPALPLLGIPRLGRKVTDQVVNLGRWNLPRR